MNWILIGLPRSGKTTVGSRLAELMHYAFIDTDQELEKRHHLSCREIVLQKGESFFREEEKKLILSLHMKNSIVSIGGGCVDSEVLGYLKSLGKIIYLRCSEKTILQRAKLKPLPVTFNLEKEAELREEIFKAAADWIVDTDGLSYQKLVRFIQWQVIHLEQSLELPHGVNHMAKPLALS